MSNGGRKPNNQRRFWLPVDGGEDGDHFYFRYGCCQQEKREEKIKWKQKVANVSVQCPPVACLYWERELLYLSPSCWVEVKGVFLTWFNLRRNSHSSHFAFARRRRQRVSRIISHFLLGSDRKTRIVNLYVEKANALQYFRDDILCVDSITSWQDMWS